MYHTQHEVILDFMELSENEGQKGYPVLKKACQISWYKLFKDTKESVVRKWLEINAEGTVHYPKSLESLLGLHVVDSCGDLVPLYEDNGKNIIVKPSKKCGCNACDTNSCLCSTIQDAITQQDVVIDGVPYTNITVTRVLKNGQVVEETTSHVASFSASGTFAGAVPMSSQTYKFTVDTLPCGCPVNNEENAKKLLGCGCIIDCYAPYTRQSYPALYNEFGYYKVEDENRKIHVFDQYGKKTRLTQVLAVWKSNGFDILVPDYARMALMALLDYTRQVFSPSFSEEQKDAAKRRFNSEEFLMIKHLNPIPYEWFIQVADPFKKNQMNGHYYGRPHSDFVAPEVVQVCNPLPMVQNVTNLINTSKNKFKKIVDFEDGPVSGNTIYQHNDLAGLGSLSGGKIDIRVDKNDMYNWGPNPEFTFNGTTITWLNGYTWQPGSVLIIDLNQ